ncbi:hypothetical protein B0I32_13811 [Nonomuraea fuscirosea]|uniref:Uncharacterized protein n=1 Tax=Nonomuraea fuscirosea TaxID=1291556 RepID=A0A2T0LZS3_9ACTN|nr:hypothetical protein [Nonomuraea fuscirosea]PRX49706.1 hypothetical protein B0I32_13811 [Nonomuraea fuscirosea]
MNFDQRVRQLREQNGYSLTRARRQAFTEAQADLKAREEAMFDEIDQDG